MPTCCRFSEIFIPTENTPNINVEKWNLLGTKVPYVPFDMPHVTFQCNPWKCCACGANLGNHHPCNLRKITICQFTIPPTEGDTKNILHMCITTPNPLFKHVKNFLLKLYMLSGFPLAQSDHRSPVFGTTRTYYSVLMERAIAIFL